MLPHDRIDSQVPVPLQRRDETRQDGFQTLPAKAIGSFPEYDERLADRLGIDPPGQAGWLATPMTNLGSLCLELLSGKGLESAFLEEIGMVQKRRFSGNTRNLSADPDRSRVGAGFRESLVAVLGLQFRENRVYPRSSSQ